MRRVKVRVELRLKLTVDEKIMHDCCEERQDAVVRVRVRVRVK